MWAISEERRDAESKVASKWSLEGAVEDSAVESIGGPGALESSLRTSIATGWDADLSELTVELDLKAFRVSQGLRILSEADLLSSSSQLGMNSSASSEDGNDFE